MWNWSNWDSRAGQVCPQPAEKCTKLSAVFPLWCSSRRRSTRPLVTSKRDTGAGPLKGCSFYPHLKFALFKKRERERIKFVTLNFLLHQSMQMRCTQGEGWWERESSGMVMDKNLVQVLLGVHTVFVSLFRCCWNSRL